MIRPEYFKYLNDIFNSGVVPINMAHLSLSDKFKIDIGVAVEVVREFLQVKHEEQDKEYSLSTIGAISEALARSENLAVKLIKSLALGDQREIRKHLVLALNQKTDPKQ